MQPKNKVDCSSYDMTWDGYWVPICEYAIADENKVLETIADLNKTGIEHRVLQYRKGVLMVEKKVDFTD